MLSSFVAYDCIGESIVPQMSKGKTEFVVQNDYEQNHVDVK
jgi:hypothetical protein